MIVPVRFPMCLILLVAVSAALFRMAATLFRHKILLYVDH